MVRLPNKELFRPDEVAKLFGFKTVRTVQNWIRSGKIRYIVTPGGHRRIPKSEIEKITQEMR